MIRRRSLLKSGGVDYSKQYLTFEALESGTFQLSNNAVQYSLDGGGTWTTLAAATSTPTVNAGSNIMFKATLTPISSFPYGIGRFSSTGRFNAIGNPMSLLYGDNFIGQVDLTEKDYAFVFLFYNCTNLVNAENLSLPATTLSTWSYYGMFNDCSGLTTVPTLPATTLALFCYHGMFLHCTSLTTLPSNYLSATTLARSCYANMFNGCTSLTTAPTLPATTLALACYQQMFYGCTSLTSAPELPATTALDYCYNNMFRECTSLNKIICLATNISATECTKDWVFRVAASGTFTKAASMTAWTTGSSGIPSGWTVQDASA